MKPQITFVYCDQYSNVFFNRYSYRNESSIKKSIKSHLIGNLTKNSTYNVKEVFINNNEDEYSDEFIDSLNSSECLCIICKEMYYKQINWTKLINRFTGKVIAVMDPLYNSKLGMSDWPGKIIFPDCDILWNNDCPSYDVFEKVCDIIYRDIRKLFYPLRVVEEIKKGTEVLGQLVELDVMDNEGHNSFVLHAYTPTMLEYSLDAIKARNTYNDFVYLSCHIFVDNNQLNELISPNLIHDRKYENFKIIGIKKWDSDTHGHEAIWVDAELRILISNEYNVQVKAAPKKIKIALSNGTSDVLRNTANEISELSRSIVINNIKEV